MKDESEFSPAVIYQAWERCLASCERCGKQLKRARRGWDWSAHHRKPRGAGGTSSREVGLVTNCLILCGHGVSGCHGEIEANRAAAYDAGYLVHQNDDPGEIPVELFMYGVVHLEMLGLVR